MKFTTLIPSGISLVIFIVVSIMISMGSVNSVMDKATFDAAKITDADVNRIYAQLTDPASGTDQARSDNFAKFYTNALKHNTYYWIIFAMLIVGILASLLSIVLSFW